MSNSPRSMHCRLSLLCLSAASALALISAPAQAAPPATVTCGQTLTQSVTLANDLTDCPGDGLVIGADNITVDLNGHTIDGAINPATDCDIPGPTGIGVNNQSGYDGVTVKRGTLQQFDNGFRGGSNTTGMSDGRVQQLTVRDNRSAGIGIGRSTEGPNPGPPHPANSDNQVDHNVVADNNRCGFGLGITLGDTSQRNEVSYNNVNGSNLGILAAGLDLDRNVIEHNTVADPRFVGILVGFGNDSHSAIRRNSVSGSGDVGILVGDQHVEVKGNQVFGSAFAGIRLDHASDSTVSKNRVSRNADGMNISGNGIQITGNKVSRAVGCQEGDELGCGYGITIENGEGNILANNRISRVLRDGIGLASYGDPTVGTVVRDNLVRGAGVDGISISTQDDEGTVTDTLLLRNRAIGSGDDGIDVEEASTTLTRNRAFRNHDLGIEAVSGVTDGGGNRAAANGNPLQCTNVFCN